ncbi:hypothetical protein F1188_16160 [Roseospira marina]|uniref:Uncharacterized protein n=1 Tax=Roseospira marina TaxID=140057 RepID=A0A5M6I8B9_9PROT|nr:zinc-finger-containing protein [Roseospira marina]KAA5604441.1 hypothetical protein F1188_16160 [Roseospira marina]
MRVPCPYCGADAELVTGAVIYPHRPDLARKHFWRCAPCGAWVGCHKNSRRHAPLGRLANAELRRAKNEAHVAFDAIWRGGIMPRAKAYAWLAEKLEIDRDACHIGMFDTDACDRTVRVCREIAKAPPNENAKSRMGER